MDSRVEEHARIIVEHSTAIEPGDTVLITAAPAASNLTTALYRLLGERGASPLTLTHDDRRTRAFLQASDPDAVSTPDHRLAAVETSDVLIAIRGQANLTELADISPETMTAFSEARAPLQREMLDKRWCGTQYPTPARAQRAEMSTEAYEDFVWNAVNRDWEAQHEFQDQLVEILDPADEVRIVSGETTDVTMSVTGNHAGNEAGKKNLPGGEVGTAPLPDSVEGEVLFDRPVLHEGTEMMGVHLVFEDGEVTEYSADENEGALAELLDTDEGARRLGELGIGMNQAIDRFTYNTLFDEKMAETVHMALGFPIPDTVGEDNEQNESAVHVDMIVDMSDDSSIEVDGEVVQRDGTFRFEDGFE